MTQTDLQGRPHSYLASEENFQVLRDYETKNLIVPLVGDFAGDKALRSVGRFLRQHGATVGAFYTSNVESYLFKADGERKVLDEPLDIADRQAKHVPSYAFTAAGFIDGRPDYETSTVLDPIGGGVTSLQTRPDPILR